MGIARVSAATLGFVVAGAQRVQLSGSTLAVSVPITGTAVVQSTSDVTAGRLLTTGTGVAQAYRAGNILGPVSQSGGVPTGAVMENEANANGSFTRFAGGTQICTATLTLTYLARFGCTGAWTFPATFSGVPSVTCSIIVLTPSTFTPLPEQLAAGDIAFPSPNAVQLRVRRINVQTNFVPSDTVMVSVVAAGIEETRYEIDILTGSDV